ncbi:asparaginase-domain-containing protein [Rozella allomycis CSF55]|uniref:asparaginase n=1 Tax=Rozella allomycis (strain CSF55) TaxID=988480 RepID=A0A4P9YN41_ROZAC|nr:asparaginase-domain-containing protein [Rozella allomycis CSF55]
MEPLCEETHLNESVAFQQTDAGISKMIHNKMSKVLIIYTGGTIGMKYNEKRGYIPVPNYMYDKLASMSQFHDVSFVPPMKETQLSALSSPNPAKNKSVSFKLPNKPTVNKNKFLVTPPSIHQKRVMYSILEYSPLLDSCDMSMDEWIRIATDIELNYHSYDAFIVLHGTDTMAYTASALSFLLEDLGKTVIVTGAQVPIGEVRTDATNNILGALMVAGHYQIPEVGLFFNNKLYRGNRSVKANAMDFDAFESPNQKPLVKMGININVNWGLVLRPDNISQMRAQKTMNSNVGSLRLFPSISETTIRSFLAPPMQGVVLQTFGVGNAPTRPDLLSALKEASDRGVVIVNVSQCRKGNVSDVYATGRALTEVGVIPGSDMTLECALTKLSYLLGKGYPPDEVRRLMKKSLRGEMTSSVDKNLFSFSNSEFLKNIFSAVKAENSQEKDFVQQSIFPVLHISAASKGCKGILEKLLNETNCAYINCYDSNAKTMLHVASAKGHYELVEYLIMAGANVHLKDSGNKNSLITAIMNNQIEIATLLIKAGARITVDDNSIQLFFRAIEAGNDRLIKVWLDSGIDINFQNIEGKTALHKAVFSGDIAIVQLLLNECKDRIQKNLKDRWNRRPVDDAAFFGYFDIVNLLFEDQE